MIVCAAKEPSLSSRPNEARIEIGEEGELKLNRVII